LQTNWLKKKADVEEGKFEQSEFYTWLLQQPESQNLLKLQELMTDRHEVAHTDLRSSISQDNFLRSVVEFNWKEYFPDYALLVTEMISRLKDVKKKANEMSTWRSREIVKKSFLLF